MVWLTMAFDGLQLIMTQLHFGTKCSLLMNSETTQLMDSSKASRIMDDVILGVLDSWHVLLNGGVCTKMEAQMYTDR